MTLLPSSLKAITCALIDDRNGSVSLSNGEELFLAVTQRNRAPHFAGGVAAFYKATGRVVAEDASYRLKDFVEVTSLLLQCFSLLGIRQIRLTGHTASRSAATTDRDTKMRTEYHGSHTAGRKGVCKSSVRVTSLTDARLHTMSCLGTHNVMSQKFDFRVHFDHAATVGVDLYITFRGAYLL